MSLSEYFEQHEEQAFVAKALATAVAIILNKDLVPGLGAPGFRWPPTLPWATIAP